MKMTEIGIGLLGFGTVGKGIHDLLEANGDEIAQRRGVRLSIRKVAVRDFAKHKSVDPSMLTTDTLAVVNDPACQVIAEVMGGEEPALQCISRALELKKPTATANKLVVASHLRTLIELARKNETGFLFEAAVCAGIPILSSLERGIAGNHIEGVTGILNGTTNFILTRMKDANLEFEEALAEATDLGYAEADPSSDVDGWDGAYKLSILASLSTGQWLNPELVRRKSIRQISKSTIHAAAALGCKIKLAARFSNSEGSRMATVEPVFVFPSHALFGVDGTENIVQIEARPVGKLEFRGSGAGAGTTASGVVSDLIQMAVDLKNGHQGVPDPILGDLSIQRNTTAPAAFAVVINDDSGVDLNSLERSLRPIQIVNSHTFFSGTVYLTEACSKEIFVERIASASDFAREFYEVLS